MISMIEWLEWLEWLETLYKSKNKLFDSPGGAVILTEYHVQKGDIQYLVSSNDLQ
jgi:hypothetical protein